MRPERSGRSSAVALLVSVGATLSALSAYVAVWELVAPGYYLFLILGTYASLGGVALLQVVRAAKLDEWTRRVGALGVVVGLSAAIFLGLRPRPACLDTGPCLSGLSPHPFQLALGVALASGSLFLDRRSRGSSAERGEE
jgi:uncharacterized membrane protein HdeD (DUF308 family)